MERQEWIIDVIMEYIVKNQIKTSMTRINKLHDYFVSEGYDESISIVLSALESDSKVNKILCK